MRCTRMCTVKRLEENCFEKVWVFTLNIYLFVYNESKYRKACLFKKSLDLKFHKLGFNVT